MTQQLVLSSSYLPFYRHLDYTDEHIASSDFIEMMDGAFGLPIAESVAFISVFSAKEQYITSTEYQQLKKFYQDRYFEKFKFKHPAHHRITQGRFKENPDSQRIIFTPSFIQRTHIYYSQSLIIKKNGITINNFTVNPNTLETSFSNPPLIGDDLLLEIEYDYQVIFDTLFGLKATLDNQSKGYLTSFKLIAV
jgi:hypothetical protein